MKNIDMTCPKCGAPLKPDRRKGEAVCEYCGYHLLIEKEETVEEIQAKAQAKSYGYHKGKLRAEEEAKEAKKEKHQRIRIGGIVFGVVALLIMIPAFAGELLKPRINPFDYIHVSFQGKDGEGEIVLEIVNVSEKVDINRVDFDISKDDWLLEGETITIQASSDDYRLSERTKAYIVEGLDEYLKDLENLPKEAIEFIHAQSETALKLNLEDSKATGAFVEMRPVKLFLATDGKQANVLYDVFEARFKTNDGEVTYYVAAAFDEVVVTNKEQGTLSMSYGMYMGHISQVQGWLHIMAYDSVEQIRIELLNDYGGSMEIKELDL